jgi:serine/threonine protein kinase
LDDSAKQDRAPDGTLPTAYEKPARKATPHGGGLMANALAGTVLGKYRIVRPLGSGGMGAVYEATHVEIGKAVAVKILNTQLAADPKAHERFRREATNLSRLEHPNIVNVTDFGEEDGTPYLVMERLYGEDLADHIAHRRAGMSVTDAVDVMLPVCAAIFAAHQGNVIHRDLKPRNIFLAGNSVNEVVPKVLDFGISRLASEKPGASLTDSGALLGTVPYLPPEHLRGGQCDARSDQYTLGVVLFECLTGRLPHDGQTHLVIMQEIVAGRFFRPSSFRPDLPQDLERIILRAMSLNPPDRFASVFELGRELLRFASPREQVIWAKYFSGEDARIQGTQSPQPTAPMQVSPGPALGPTNQAAFGTPGGPAGQWYWQSATNERPSYPTTDRVSPVVGKGRRAFVALSGIGAIGALAAVVAKRWRPWDRSPGPALVRADVAATKTPDPTAPATRRESIGSAAPPTFIPEVTIDVVGAPVGAVAKLDGYPASLPLRLPRASEQRDLTIWAPGFETASLKVVPTEDRQLQVALRPITPEASTPPPAPTPSASASVVIRVESRPVRAEVWVEGESASRGRTPLSIKLPRSSRSTRISLRSAGFQSSAQVIVPTKSQLVDLRLRHVPSPRAEGPHENAGDLQLLRIQD